MSERTAVHPVERGLRRVLRSPPTKEQRLRHDRVAERRRQQVFPVRTRLGGRKRSKQHVQWGTRLRALSLVVSRSNARSVAARSFTAPENFSRMPGRWQTLWYLKCPSMEEGGVFARPTTGPFGMGKRSLSWMRSGVRWLIQTYVRPARLALRVEQLPASIAIFDADMRYLAVSHRFLSELEYVFRRRLPSPTEVVGRSHYEIFPDLPLRGHEAHLRVLAGEELAAQEDFVPHEDGSTDCLRWSLRPWRTANGQIGGELLFIELITDQVTAKHALAESEARFRLHLRMPPSASHTLALISDGSEPIKRCAVFSAGQWMSS